MFSLGWLQRDLRELIRGLWGFAFFFFFGGGGSLRSLEGFRSAGLVTQGRKTGALSLIEAHRPTEPEHGQRNHRVVPC